MWVCPPACRLFGSSALLSCDILRNHCDLDVRNSQPWSFWEPHVLMLVLGLWGGSACWKCNLCVVEAHRVKLITLCCSPDHLNKNCRNQWIKNRPSISSDCSKWTPLTVLYYQGISSLLQSNLPEVDYMKVTGVWHSEGLGWGLGWTWIWLFVWAMLLPPPQ